LIVDSDDQGFDHLTWFNPGTARHQAVVFRGGVKIDDRETYLRTITSGELGITGTWRWCEQWWRHDEAVTALWYGWGHHSPVMSSRVDRQFSCLPARVPCGVGLAAGTWVRLYRRGMTTNDEVWVPEACTLPTADRPLRLAEFDDLFATALRGQQRLSATRLRWRLNPAAERAARDLTGRESECCSFFSFTLVPAGGVLQIDVEVPTAHVAVLDALADRAAAGIGS
jgi:hypothetical protein